MVSISEPEMLLKLSVVNCSPELSAEKTTVTIGKDGGSIGRARKKEDTPSHLMLTGDDVSSSHAIISYEDGVYFLTDRSANGTEISNKGLFLHHQKVPLEDGDNLIIGDFKIAVSIEPLSTQNASEEGSPLVWFPPVDPPIVDPPPTSNVPPPFPEKFGLDDIFGNTPPSDSPLEPPYEPPQPPPVPETPVISENRDNELLKSFWDGAGVDDAPVISDEKVPATMHLLGEVFREMVDGLMVALKARAEQRNVIRASVTHIQSASNNPLKHMPRVEDAMKNMLLQDNASFIPALEAVREGFANLMNDQMAMHAGVQAVLNHTLAKFSPERITSKFAEGFVLQKKAKCWDEYCERYPILYRLALDDFFNEIFVQAFEEQIDKLRGDGASGQDNKSF